MLKFQLNRKVQVNLVHVKSADEAICTLTWLCGIFKAPRN